MMSDNQGVGRSRPVKALASISAGLSLLVGGLLFAEHDASANHLPAEFSEFDGHSDDPIFIDQDIVLGQTPTPPTGVVGQAVTTDGINVDQSIITSQACPELLLSQAVSDDPLSITQRIQLGACPVPSG